MTKFREVEEAECNYLIDVEGNVYSKLRNKYLKSVKNKPNGYLRVPLRIKGKSKFKYIHRLIMYYFNPVKGMENLQVNHKNGIKTDNRLENLEWCTNAENTRHSWGELGRKAACGEKQGNSYMTSEQVKEIRKAYEKPYHGIGSDLAKKYNTTNSNIHDIAFKKSWKHIK